jgi:hypothetical protein
VLAWFTAKSSTAPVATAAPVRTSGSAASMVAFTADVVVVEATPDPVTTGVLLELLPCAAVDPAVAVVAARWDMSLPSGGAVCSAGP